jgi:hypothetical protein
MKRRPLTVGISSEGNIDADEVHRFVTAEPSPPRKSLPIDGSLAAPATETEFAEATRTKPRAKSTGVRPVGLIPVTVRLRPEVAGALKRASLQRQLAGESIFTQQDLVELALEPWLRRERYL